MPFLTLSRRNTAPALQEWPNVESPTKRPRSADHPGRVAVRPRPLVWSAGLLSGLLSATPVTAQVDRVIAALDRSDCPAAVDALNEGMAKSESASFVIAGQLYETGRCLRADPAKAAAVYERAAQDGNVVAARSLALLYARGSGVPQSYPRAGFWFSVRTDHAAGAIDAASYATPDAIARTYVEAVHDVAAQSIDYPDHAAEQGVHARVTVRFEPRAGTVTIVDSSDNRRASATSFGPSRHSFERATIAAYANAVAALQRPPIPDDIDAFSERTLVFERDHNDRDPGRGLARGFTGF